MKYMTATQTKTLLAILGLMLSIVLLAHGSWGQDGSTTIIITPVTGAANTFELIRVHPNEVEVGREGIRLSFSRDQVARARNPEAETILAEAASTLEQVEQENLEEFPDLLERMERSLPRVQGVVQRFDWLIPQATATLAEVEQTVFDIRNTLLASERLEAVIEEVERMAEGAAPLAEDWEESISKAMAEAQLIPYLSIREKVLVRISKAKRAIRLDLANKTGRTFARIKTLGADLLAQGEKETLSEERWSLGMSEMKRLRDSIPEPEAREEIEEYIQQVEAETEEQIRKLRTQRMFASAQEAVGSVEKEIESGTIVPASGEEIPQIENLRAILAQLPESSTKTGLEDRFANIEHRIEKAVSTMLLSATPETLVGESDSEEPPETVALLQQEWFIPVAVGGGIGVLILLLLVLLIRKKNKQVVPGAVPEGDIFTSSPDAWQKTKEEPLEEETPPGGLPPEAATQEDVFGFTTDGPAEGESTHTSDSLIEESTADSSPPVMEDPFALDQAPGSSDLGFLAGQDEPAEVEDPLAPTEEVDLFASDENPNPEDDPLGLTIGRVAEDETHGETESGPETEEGEEPRESREEDPFNFNDFLSSSEEEDSGASSTDDDIFGFSEEKK